MASLPDDPNAPRSPDVFVEPLEWRVIGLESVDSIRGRISALLLRPERWVEAAGAVVGQDIWLAIPEMGVRQWATVCSIEPCPADAAGSLAGMVTGTFTTERATTLELHLQTSTHPIGVTGSHRFYSHDRDAWTPACELRPGEPVRTADGEALVALITLGDDTQAVYNLEVAGTHTYFVGDAKAWVHNGCVSLIKRDRRLVKEAQRAGKVAQESLDRLVEKLAKGNEGAGIGRRHLFRDVFEARASDGARVYYRIRGETVEILAKSVKANQQRVIAILEELYGY